MAQGPPVDVGNEAYNKECLMKEPTTTLDTRFSDPEAVATEWQGTRRILEMAELFWISTVRADGRPQRYAARCRLA